MHPGEHQRMAAVEDSHFWYRGLRDLIARVLAGMDLPEHPAVLDAGCGTGANLRLLERTLAPAYLGGFDRSEEAIRWARDKAPSADLYVSDLCAPVLHHRPLDLITSFDVLYITGLEPARDGLRELRGALAPGGRIMLHLPAFEWLRSEHDVAVHTRERFRAPQIGRALEGLGLEVEFLSYRLCALFPLLAASRIMRRLRQPAERTQARSDLHRPPPPIVGRALARVIAAENRQLAGGMRFAFGSSVFAVGRAPL